MQYPEEKQPPDVMTSDANNATIIQPKEAPPGKRDKFRRFRAYNRGMWNGPKRENTELINRQDDLQRYDSISSKLLTDYQKRRGRKIFDRLDFHKFGGSIDSIIFAVCVIVANADVEGGTRYWPGPDVTESDFAEIADSFGLGWKKQISVINKVRSRVDL